METVLTKQQVAEMLQCSVRSVDRLRKQEALPFFTLRNMVRFNQEDVLKWIQQKREKNHGNCSFKEK